MKLPFLRRRVNSGTAAIALLSVVYGGWGLSMLLQPHRWLSTPAYLNLFAILPVAVWGVIYLTAGTIGLTGIWALTKGHTEVARVGLTLMIVLTVAWLVAFGIRYLTSPSTTPFTFGSSLLHIFMLALASCSEGQPGGIADQLPASPRRA